MREIERYRFDHRIDGPELLGAMPPEGFGAERKAFEKAAKGLAVAQWPLGKSEPGQRQRLLGYGCARPLMTAIASISICASGV